MKAEIPGIRTEYTPELPSSHLPSLIYNIKRNNDTDKERWMTSPLLGGSDVFSRFSPLTLQLS